MGMLRLPFREEGEQTVEEKGETRRQTADPEKGKMEEVRVTVVPAERPGEASRLLARCFYANPNFVDLFPSQRARSRVLLRMFVAGLRDATRFGHVHAAMREIRETGRRRCRVRDPRRGSGPDTTGGKMIIKDVPLTGIFVNDQEAALDFYTNKLGLQKVQDEPYGESGARWITVSPAEMRIRIVLKKAEKEHEKAMVGRSDGAPILTLSTDDIYAAYDRLRERGVRFLGEPYRYPWGIGTLLLDQDGSPILLQQESGER